MVFLTISQNESDQKVSIKYAILYTVYVLHLGFLAYTAFFVLFKNPARTFDNLKRYSKKISSVIYFVSHEIDHILLKSLRNLTKRSMFIMPK